MKGARARVAIAACLSALLLASCGDSHEKASDDVVREVDRFFLVMSSVRDEESARAAAEEVDAIVANLERIAERYEALGEPDEKARKKIAEKVSRFSQAKQKEYESRSVELGDAGPEVIVIMMDSMRKFSAAAGRMPAYAIE